MMTATSRFRLLLLLGGAMIAIFVRMALIPHPRAEPHLYVGLYLASFLIYIAAVRLSKRSSDRAMLFAILAFALAFRLLWLPVRPTISTDIYRYIWDGRLSAAGYNPYKYVPLSPAIEHLRTGNWDSLQYRELPTPYPPASQAVFALNALLFGDRWITLKIMFVLFDLLSLSTLLLMLRRLNIPVGAIAFYAWSPLVITEVAGAGHQDIIGVSALILSLHMLLRRRDTLAGAFFAAACLVKPYVAPLIPAFARRGGLRFVLAWAISAAMLSLPFLAAGPRFTAGMLNVVNKWRRNDALFSAFDSFFGLFTEHHVAAARILSLLIVAAAMVWLSVRREKGFLDLIKGVFTVTALVLMLNNIIYPWYLIWTVPFLCFIECPGWLLLTGSIGLGYLLPVYHWSAWIRTVEFVPPLAVLAYSSWRARRQCEERLTPSQGPEAPEQDE